MAAAQAQSGVTVGGVVDAAVRTVHNQGTASVQPLVSGGNSTSKLIVRGVQDLGGGLPASFHLEHGLLLDPEPVAQDAGRVLGPEPADLSGRVGALRIGHGDPRQFGIGYVHNLSHLYKTQHDRVAHPAKPTTVTAIYRKLMRPGFNGIGFEGDPNYQLDIWAKLTIAYLRDPKHATQVRNEYVDVVNAPGHANNGQSIGYETPPQGVTLQKRTVVERFDNARFLHFYVELLTRPVPVPPK